MFSMRLALPVPTLRLPAAMRPNPAIFEAGHFSSFNGRALRLFSFRKKSFGIIPD
jgi:hypothetical protein